MRQIVIRYVRADCTLGRVLARAVWSGGAWRCGLGEEGWQAATPETTWATESCAIRQLHILLDERPKPVPSAHRDVACPIEGEGPDGAPTPCGPSGEGADA